MGLSSENRQVLMGECSLQWRLLNRLFRRRSKKTSKLCVTGLCAGNSLGTDEFPAQVASNAENVSIWWRHHVPWQPFPAYDAANTGFIACHCSFEDRVPVDFIFQSYTIFKWDAVSWYGWVPVERSPRINSVCKRSPIRIETEINGASRPTHRRRVLTKFANFVMFFVMFTFPITD